MGPPPPPLPPKPYTISSSPGRSEKLPTPGLARLLRGKSGSRSRNRTSLSRSSPLFSSGSRSISRTDAGDGGEPSSPKVTCIGQVRIRNKSKPAPIRSDVKGSNNPKKKKKKRGEETEMCCCFIKQIVDAKSIWRRCSSRLRFNVGGRYRRGNERIKPADPDPDPDPDPDLPPCNESDETGRRNCFDEAEQDDESEFRVSAPPKNALILMRCRSAPHNRSSSLAARFFPIQIENGAENGEDEDGKEPVDNGGEELEEEEEEEDKRCRSSRPLFLKRCKSEPAAKAARLVVPEAQTGGGRCGFPATFHGEVND